MRSQIKRFIPSFLLNVRRTHLINHPLKRFVREYKIAHYKKRHKTIFLTFADGISFTSDRIVKQASAIGFFDRIIAHSRTTLGNDFLHRFRTHLQHQRGYGFWSWKPSIIAETLETMKDGDFLVYADSGCTFSDYARVALEDILLVYIKQSHAFYLPDDSNKDHLISQWTKADVLSHFGYLNDRKVLNTRLWEAGRLGIFKSPSTVKLVS
jgi:hypothetical protein